MGGRETKGELKKAVEKKGHPANRITAVETADKMTSNKMTSIRLLRKQRTS
jgi:hypothetical protein